MDTHPSDIARQLNALRPRAESACERCGRIYQTYAKSGGRFCSTRCRKAVWTAAHREQETARIRVYRARQRARTDAGAMPPLVSGARVAESQAESPPWGGG